MPVDQPECETNQFANGPIEGAYIETYRDKYGNELTVDQSMNRGATAGLGDWGNRQFAANSQDIQSTGYGRNQGLNVIEYGQGAAFQQAESTFVEVSRADRGKDNG